MSGGATGRQPANSGRWPDDEDLAWQQLREEMSDGILENLHTSLQRAVNIGDTDTAAVLRERISTTARRRGCSKNRVQIYLRSQTLKRQRDDETRRAKAAEDLAERQKLRLTAKIAESKAVRAKAHASIATNLVRIRQTRARAHAAKEKEKTERLRFRFAAALAKYLLRQTGDLHFFIGKLLLNEKVPVRTDELRFPLDIFPGDRTLLRDISCGRGQKVCSSEAFAFVLFEGRRPQEFNPQNADPVVALNKLTAKVLPRYSQVVKRYPVEDLLRDSNLIADGAFLRAVWAYSSFPR